MQINATDALGEGKISRLFWKLALPAIAAQVINLLYNLVDRMYIGQMCIRDRILLFRCLPARWAPKRRSLR